MSSDKSPLSNGFLVNRDLTVMPPTIQIPKVIFTRQIINLEDSNTARICCLLFELCAVCILAFLIGFRAARVKNWKAVPFLTWLVFSVNSSAILYILAAAVLQYAVSSTFNNAACTSAGILCLLLYSTVKIPIFLFLLERAYIIRDLRRDRFKSMLYIINLLVTMSSYVVIVCIGIIYRIESLEDGHCRIGIKRTGIIPIISFDALANIYFTGLFLVPLMTTYSIRPTIFKYWSSDPPSPRIASPRIDHEAPNPRLKALARKTIIGGGIALLVSLVNVTVLMSLDGEPAWVCLFCCCVDVTSAALVLYWVS